MFCGRNVLVTDVLVVVMYYYGLVLTVYTLGGNRLSECEKYMTISFVTVNNLSGSNLLLNYVLVILS